MEVISFAALAAGLIMSRRDLIRDFENRYGVTRPDGALDAELFAIIVVEFVQAFHDEVVHREPDWPAPIRVATEVRNRRFGGLIVDCQWLISHVKHERIVFVGLRQRANAEVRQELVRVEQSAQKFFHPVPAQQRQ